MEGGIHPPPPPFVRPMVKLRKFNVHDMYEFERGEITSI